MSSSAQRKRRTTGTPLVSSPSMKTSKVAQANRATNSSRAANRAAVSNRAARETAAANTTVNGTANINSMPNDESDLPTETIDVMDNRAENSVVVVDLTCEGSESAVVDLTNNDSVLVIDEGHQQSQGSNAESYVVSSDEDDVTPNVISAAVMSSYQKARSTPGTISCPVCLDTYTEIVDSGRLVVSTKCGHVFCSQCLRDALSSSHTCPTCRKRLTNRQYHPLYV